MSGERENRPGAEDIENAAANKQSIILRAIKYATDNQREIIAWGMFVLLAAYVGVEILPLAPKHAPDAGVVGAIATALISLLAAGNGGGKA